MSTACLSPYLRYVLSDEEERRIRDLAAAADRGTLLRWVGELLEDRKERSALLQRLGRRLGYTRRRLRQASDYLDRLLPPPDGPSRDPWPGERPCPHRR